MSERENANWMPDAPLLLSIVQAAAMLGLSTGTVKNLLRSGELVRRKVGARTLIPRTSVENFVRRDHLTTKEEVQ
jgi:excisionase family DNA binding protein